MRERVVSLGGNLTIKSAPGTGTSIKVKLPPATGEKTVHSESRQQKDRTQQDAWIQGFNSFPNAYCRLAER
jgi:hypothetical protein